MDQEELIAIITKVAAKHQAAGGLCHLNYDEVAIPAIRRWASSIRPKVPQDNMALRIHDLAKELTLAETSGRRTVDKSVVALATDIAACMPPDPVDSPAKQKRHPQ